MAGPGRHAERVTPAQRRERRAAVDDPAVVLDAAARFLEPRARSESEVRRRLGQAGYRPELVDGTIARLYQLGMLDDEAFARAWIESRDRARPRGERALQQELAQKGIDREIVTGLLEERRAGHASSHDDDVGSPDEAAAVRLLARHARALARIPDVRQRRQRAYALLARNGFAPDVCRSLSATVVSSEPSAVEDA